MSAFDKYKILHGLPSVGQKIKYVKPTKQHWFANVVEDEKNLELNKEYTVAKVELNSSATYVWLEEFPTNEKEIPFFNMSAFEWEMPELNYDELIGFTIYDIYRLKYSYGYIFKQVGKDFHVYNSEGQLLFQPVIDAQGWGEIIEIKK